LIVFACLYFPAVLSVHRGQTDHLWQGIGYIYLCGIYQ